MDQAVLGRPKQLHNLKHRGDVEEPLEG